MIVDAHHHLWDLDERDQAWIEPRMSVLRRDFLPPDLHAALDGTGVDATVLVQTVADPDETPEMLVLADTVDRIGAVVGWVDLTARDTRDRLGQLLRHPSGRWLRGIRHPVEFEDDPEWLARTDVLDGLAAVEDAGLVYELLVRPHQLPAAERAARRFPQLTFVLDHCGRPPVGGGDAQAWKRGVRQLAEHGNVVCKLSGLVAEMAAAGMPAAGMPAAGNGPPARDGPEEFAAVLRPYAEVVLDAFGPRRLMFGSDWPVCLLAAGYRAVLDVADRLTRRLDETDRAALFAGTARQVYELG